MINIYVIEYFAILGSSIFLIRTWWVTHGLLLGNVFNYHKHQYLSPRDTNWTNIIWFHHEADHYDRDRDQVPKLASPSHARNAAPGGGGPDMQAMFCDV